MSLSLGSLGGRRIQNSRGACFLLLGPWECKCESKSGDHEQLQCPRLTEESCPRRSPLTGARLTPAPLHGQCQAGLSSASHWLKQSHPGPLIGCSPPQLLLHPAQARTI